MKEADRYTVLHKPISMLPEIADACAKLGLFWFAITSDMSWCECAVYIFFDKNGMENYMRGYYDKP